MARRGRKRRLDVKRYANGRIVYDDPVIPQMALVRRSEISGLPVDDKKLRTLDVASALGQLHVIGIIKDHHRNAGLRLFVADRQWSRAIAAPARHAKIADLGAIPKGPASEPPLWEKARQTFDSAKSAVRHGLHWKMIESVVIDDVVPPAVLDNSNHGNRMKSVLVEAFDQLAKYYGLTKA